MEPTTTTTAAGPKAVPQAVLDGIREDFMNGIAGATRTTFRIVFRKTVERLRALGADDDDVIKFMHVWGVEAGITRQWVNACLRDNGIVQRTPGTPVKRKYTHHKVAITTAGSLAEPGDIVLKVEEIDAHKLALLGTLAAKGDKLKAASMLIDASEIAMEMRLQAGKNEGK